MDKDEVAMALGRIEGTLSEMKEDIKKLDSIETRVRSLESFRSYAQGAGAIIGAVLGWLGFSLGSSHGR